MLMNARTAIAGAALLAASLIAPAARAATPALETVLPRGGQRGTEVELVLRGTRLENAKEVFVYDKGLTVEKVETVSPGEVKAVVKIAPDARLGEHAMRLRTSTGITELRNFYVGPFPVVDEEADVQNAPAGGRRRGGSVAAQPAAPATPGVNQPRPPSTFDKPQKIDLNVTVAGVLENEQIDYYQVECKKGQRLTVEVEGTRLGSTGSNGQGSFDPAVTIVDSSKAELASADDSPLFKQDCVAQAVIPHDGLYTIQLRDGAFGGSPRSYYRMHVGNFPRPTAVFPAGGKAGEEVKVTFLGDAAGPFETTVKLPADPKEPFTLVAEKDGQSAPSANPFRITNLPNAMEAEPNDDAKAVSAAAVDAPVAFNGIIEKAGDADTFRFKATKGQVLDINVFARRVRSALDPVLVVMNKDGNQIAANDDSGGPDAYLRFTVPADGEFFVNVRDHLKRGGPEFVYRIELAPVEPKLFVLIPNMSQNAGQPSQERQHVVIARGNRYGTLIRANRADVAGDFNLEVSGLPDGVKMIAQPLVAGQDAVPVIFEAAADAPVSGKLCDLVAKPASEKEGQSKVEGRFDQLVEMAIGQNNTSYHSVRVGKLAVAVVDELPFGVQIVQPKAPLSQSGQMELKVVAERKGDFKGPINVKMLLDPAGVSSGTVTIPADKTEVVIPLNSTPAAPVKKWAIAVQASADVNGPAWVSSPPAELEIVPPVVAMKIVRSKIEQGQAGQVKVEVEQKNPFSGKAKVELLGLPNNATAEPKEIGPEDKEVVFDVKTDAKTPPGTTPTVFCRVTVVKDGEPIVQNLGQGGILRIDAPGTGKKPPTPVAGK